MRRLATPLAVLFTTVLVQGAARAQSLAPRPPIPEARPLQNVPVKLPPRGRTQALLQKAAERAFLEKFADEIAQRFKNKAVGWAFVAIGPAGTLVERAGGAARHAPDDAPRPMTADDKLTIASASKTFTAAALLKALHLKGLSVDTPLHPWLPKHWDVPGSVKTITFRELLTHQAGVRCDAIDYAGLRRFVANGVVVMDKPNYAYRNGNFALMRVLIPQLHGISEASMKPMVAAEAQGNPAWIAASHATLYREHVNRDVFKPGGLPLMHCKPTDAKPAHSYKSATSNKFDFSKLAPGEVWGDMSDYCGSQGWFMSARQLAQALHAVMTPGKVLPAAWLTQMKEGNLGVNWANHDGGLESWSHGGYHPAEWNKGEVGTLVIHFNNGVSAAYIVNSPYHGNAFGDVVAAAKAAMR